MILAFGPRCRQGSDYCPVVPSASSPNPARRAVVFGVPRGRRGYGESRERWQAAANCASSCSLVKLSKGVVVAAEASSGVANATISFVS